MPEFETPKEMLCEWCQNLLPPKSKVYCNQSCQNNDIKWLEIQIESMRQHGWMKSHEEIIDFWGEKLKAAEAVETSKHNG